MLHDRILGFGERGTVLHVHGFELAGDGTYVTCNGVLGLEERGTVVTCNGVFGLGEKEQMLNVTESWVWGEGKSVTCNWVLGVVERGRARTHTITHFCSVGCNG